MAVRPRSCRKQKPEKIRTSFSRRWTEPGFLRAAMEVLAVVVEAVAVAGAAALAARRAPGLRHPVAMFQGNKHPDDGMTGITGVTGVIKPPISQIR